MAIDHQDDTIEPAEVRKAPDEGLGPLRTVRLAPDGGGSDDGGRDQGRDGDRRASDRSSAAAVPAGVIGCGVSDHQQVSTFSDPLASDSDSTPSGACRSLAAPRRRESRTTSCHRTVSE
jgi:hypothetical protein